MLLYVSLLDLQRFLDTLKSAYLWLFSAISGLWNTIYNNTLLMTTVMLFFVLSIAFLFLWLVITISPASFGKDYAKQYFAKYPNPNHIYSHFSKSGLIYQMYDTFLKRKEKKQREDEAAQAAYEKVAEEQAKLNFYHRLESYGIYRDNYGNFISRYGERITPDYYSRVIKGIDYFDNNPDKKVAIIDGAIITRADEQ